MFSVISSNAAPHHLQQLREWFIAEWGEMDSFSGPDDGYSVPSPLLVVDGQELLGGLAFTSYPIPGSEELGLWINALIVAPEHRGSGLGSQLIQAAEVEAIHANEQELFVYADHQEFYQRLGWQNVDSSGERAVLSKAVSNR